MSENLDAAVEEQPAEVVRLDVSPPKDADPKRGLLKKLAEVMALVGRLPKRGYNDRQKYNFVLESDVKEAVRLGLALRNVVPSFDVVAHERRCEVKDSNGGLTVLTVEVSLEDADTGEKKTTRMIGYGYDSLDKGAAKAMTAAVKSDLLARFLIPTGTDLEDEASIPKPPAGGARAQPSSQGAPKPATAVARRAPPAVEVQGKALPPPAGKPTTQAPSQSARATRIWKRAQGVVGKDKFALYVAHVLGATKPSQEWTDEDMRKLEVTLEETERRRNEQGSS